MAITVIHALEKALSNSSVSSTQTPNHQVVSHGVQSMPSPITQKHLAWVWLECTNLYGTLFTSKHGVKINDAWLDALKDLTPKALESGMARLKALSAGDKFTEFPPNCLQFKALCLAFYEDLRLPSTIDAYREIRAKAYATQLNFTHPVIKFTAGKLSVDFLKIEDEAKAYAIFRRAYEQVCLLVKQGHELPAMTERPMMVRSQNKVIGQAHLAQMKALLGAR